jgi:hypothetical protein
MRRGEAGMRPAFETSLLRPMADSCRPARKARLNTGRESPGILSARVGRFSERPAATALFAQQVLRKMDAPRLEAFSDGVLAVIIPSWYWK